MTYILKLQKPENLRGNEHGKVRAYQSLYTWLINKSTGNFSPDDVKNELNDRLVNIGCTKLEVVDIPDYLEVNKGD